MAGCRKGQRDCTYPDRPTTNSSKQARSMVKAKSSSFDSGTSPSDIDIDMDQDNKDGLSVVTTNDTPNRDDIEAMSAATDFSLVDGSILDDDSAVSPLDGFAEVLQDPNPSTISSATLTHERQTAPAFKSPRWLSLPDEIRTLLLYHKEKLSHFHYAFRSDQNDFFKATFLDLAINDPSEALLHAVVAFAAYHRTFALEDPGTVTFLYHYDKAIVLLQRSLRQERPSVTTLLTILQLATIEVSCLAPFVTIVYR